MGRPPSCGGVAARRRRIDRTAHRGARTLDEQHNSGVRSEHEFFGHVADAFEGIESVLVTGSHTALADFRHYMEKHRPHVAPRIAAYQVVDHLTENQLRAIGDAHFVR